MNCQTNFKLALLKQDKAVLVCVMLVCYALSVSASAVLTSSQVIGADYYYHLDLAKILSTGNIGGAWNYNLENIYFPYGTFLFQMMLVPSVWIGQPVQLARIAEIFLMPITFALTLWLMIRYAGSKAAAVTGLVLLGGWAFMDGALQVRPESLDLMLYPLIVAAALSTKKLRFSILSVLTVYSHGPAALSNMYGLAINRLKSKAWRRTILVAFLVVLPILILSMLYVGGAFQKWGGYGATENPQEAEFWNTPFPFIPIYMGSTLLGVPFLFRRGKSEFESLLSWGLAFSLIMIPIWPDRWMHYASIPLACLAGIGVTRMTGKKKLIVGFAVISLFMLYYSMWIMMSANGQWWQPGD